MIAAIVIGREAGRRRSLGLVVLAGLAAATGVADGWTQTFHTPGADLMGLAAVFTLIELVALGVAGDPFWGHPARAAAGAVEALAAAATAVGGVVALHLVAERWSDETSLIVRPAFLVAGVLALVAWYVADLRRREDDHGPLGVALLVGAGWAPATVAMAVTALVTTALGLGAPVAVGVTAVAMAALLVAGGRDGADVMALLLVIPAPFTAGHHPVVAASMASAGALLLAAVTVIHAPLARLDAQVEAVWMLALSTALPVLAAGIAHLRPRRRAGRGHDGGARAVGRVPGARASPVTIRASRGIALVPRAAALLSLLTAPELTAAGLAALSGLLAALALADALGRRRPSLAVQTAVLAPLTLGMAMLAAGATNAVAALAVIGMAVIVTAVDDLVPESWRIVTRLSALSAAFVALTLAGPDRATLATLLVVLGGLGVVWSLRLGLVDVALLERGRRHDRHLAAPRRPRGAGERAVPRAGRRRDAVRRMVVATHHADELVGGLRPGDRAARWSGAARADGRRRRGPRLRGRRGRPGRGRDRRSAAADRPTADRHRAARRGHRPRVAGRDRRRAHLGVARPRRHASWSPPAS